MTLTRRLILLALISVLPAVGFWAYAEVGLRRAREAEVKDLALRQALLAASELERIFEGIEGTLKAVGAVPSIRALDPAACSAYLAALQPQVPHLLNMGVVDREGGVRCSARPAPPGLRLADRPYLVEALGSGAFVVGEYTVSRVNGQRVLPLALPLRGPDGAVLGIVATSLDLAWLGRQLGRRALAEGGSVTVADRNGVILAREPQPERFVGTRIPEPFQQYVRADAPGAVEVVSQDGTRRVLGYVPAGMPPRNIYVSAGLSSKAAFGPINQLAQQGVALVAGIFGLTLFLSWLGSRTFIAAPFRRLIRGMHAWRRGDYGARVAMPPRSGEFGLLADTFNKLMDDVQAREAALRESDERARLALEAGQMGTWWFEPRRHGGGWSESAARLLGFPPTKTEASLADWRSLLHPDDFRPTLAALERASRGEDFEVEVRIALPDGRRRWINARGRAVADEAAPPGAGSRIVGVLQDVTARRQAGERQKLLLDELNHRVKNTLATVQSIASQTVRNAESPERFRQAFEARLLALSKTHDLLTRNAWRDADLRALVEQELDPYRRESGGETRLRIAGPAVHLPARTAINLGLVVHELATNAAKYGALSRPDGRVEVGWTLSGGPGAAVLRLSWREIGGPPISAEPTRRGFGSRLIRRSVEGELAGRAETTYAPTGLICDLTIPLAPPALAEAAPAEDADLGEATILVAAARRA